jgi:hypothetical protein
MLPSFPEYVKTDDESHYVFEGLSTIQLKECWSICEQQKRYCHAESVFQPLIDRDMRIIVSLLKNRK